MTGSTIWSINTSNSNGCSTKKEDKIYLVLATFTARYPVEVVVIHGYTPSQTPDQAHINAECFIW
ncbi:MAG TPA: hypothetical protein VE818_00470 [Nitrososphaeraceae archaeon]|nr:hypothetical protein [Nitrososphaeraceae archaeon]